MPDVPRLDLYVLPAVVGSGLGDLAEIEAAAATLRAAGYRPRLLRIAPKLPRGLPGPFRWPPVERSVRRRAGRALTLTSQFGVSCAPRRPGPLGAPGPWAAEVAAIEASYGRDAVLHVSLEEFARTLSARQQVDERYREGGARPPRAGARRGREVREMRGLYRRFREFDRPNLLTLFPTFVPDTAFTREFPEAIQVGPVVRPGTRRRAARGARRRILWYASPPSAPRIAAALVQGLVDGVVAEELLVRGSHEFPMPTSALRVRFLGPATPSEWSRIWSDADAAIVTGSRSLLEALADGVPFVYYNGVTGQGARTRRHRPEKIRSLLRLARREGASAARRSELASFSRGQAVRRIASAWSQRTGADGPVGPSAGFPPGRASGGAFLIRLARAWATPGAAGAAVFARQVRREGAAPTPV